MGAYSVVVSDSKIIRRIAGFKSIIIMGCQNCASLSIAHDKGVPASRILTDEKTGQTTREPLAIMDEANRLKTLIESKGINARVDLWPGGPCLLAADKDSDYLELTNRCTDADAVITLCCVGGIPGVKRYLGKTAKIISGMKTLGHFHLSTFIDDGYLCIDKSKSKMIRTSKG